MERDVKHEQAGVVVSFKYYSNHRLHAALHLLVCCMSALSTNTFWVDESGGGHARRCRADGLWYHANKCMYSN